MSILNSHSKNRHKSSKEQTYAGVVSYQLAKFEKSRWLEYAWSVAFVGSMLSAAADIASRGVHLAPIIIMLACIAAFGATYQIMLLERRALKWLVGTLKGYYLEGFTAYSFYDRGVFLRLRKYLGHGLCYEASALAMLALRGNQTSRFVVAEAYSSSERSRTQHCYVETKFLGCWWVIDPTWDIAMITPRAFYRLKIRPHELRVLEYHDFWKIDLSEQMYEAISRRETSHVFLDLSAYRCVAEGKTTFLFEHFGEEGFVFRSGRQSNPFLIDIYGIEYPITPRILKLYYVKLERMHPPRRAYRLSARMAKTIMQMRKETLEAREKYGEDAMITVRMDKIDHYTMTVEPASA